MISVDDLLEAHSADESGASPGPDETRRPALRVLTDDVGELVAELVDGFDSEREVVEWSQRLATRTLGETRQRFFGLLAREYRVPEQGTVLACMLHPHARERDLTPLPDRVPGAVDGADDGTADAIAKSVRREVAASFIEPAYHRAYRRLRADATEYVDDPATGSASHAPSRQRWIAMRPALDELEHYQQAALGHCLDGLDDREAILTWGNLLEQATHGELDDEFVRRCYRETSTAELLTEPSTDVERRARLAFAAHHLIPRFNRGIRDLSGRTTEEPDAEPEEHESPSI